MTKNNPGPWFMNINGRQRSEVVDAHGERVCEVYSINDQQDLANARLLAAAPELLSSLKELLDLHRAHKSIHAHVEARAAIAKAEGR